MNTLSGFNGVSNVSNYTISNSNAGNGTYTISNSHGYAIAPDINFDNTSATLKVDGTLEVNGRDVMREIDEMRDALLLLKRDVDMEAKYPKLKALKDAYEAQLEKYKTWEALK